MLTPIYAAVLALLLMGLSFRVIRLRRQYQISLGSGQQPLLERAIRVQANFTEYVPYALLLIYFVELERYPALLIHLLGLGLLAARCIHAYGVSQPQETLKFRITGMLLTSLVLLSSALLLLINPLLS